MIEIARVETVNGCPQDKRACFAPGTGWYYSNTNTVLLGLVVEKVSKQDYGTALKTRILDPFGLTNTSHPTNAQLPSPFAHGYTIQGLPDGVTTPQDSTNWSPSEAFAVGDIISTFDDLRKWGRAAGTGQMLSHQSRVERFMQGTLPPNVPGTRAYAFGTGFNRGWFGHGGEIPGYNAVSYYRPDIDAVLVVITTSDLVQQKDPDGNVIDIHPAYRFADVIVDIAAREAPIGDFDEFVHYEGRL